MQNLISIKLAWAVKKGLELLPAKSAGIQSSIQTIGVLFSGTYGDAVQLISLLEDIYSRFPTIQMDVYLSKKLHSDFQKMFPDNVQRVGVLGLLVWLIQRRSLLITNVVGVYRVGFDLLARLGSIRSMGFCYSTEQGRKSYSLCVQIPPAHRDNLLLQQILWEQLDNSEPYMSVVKKDILKTVIPKKTHFASESHSNSEVVFHIGSAGFRQQVGDEKYLQIICNVLTHLQNRNSKITIIVGPSDTSLVTTLEQKLFKQNLFRGSLWELKVFLDNFTGTLLCFNSFFAHYTRYLNRITVVMHHNAIPAGYDCSDTHLQLILKDENNLDLEEVFSVLK